MGARNADTTRRKGILTGSSPTFANFILMGDTHNAMAISRTER